MFNEIMNIKITNLSKHWILRLIRVVAQLTSSLEILPNDIDLLLRTICRIKIVQLLNKH